MASRLDRIWARVPTYATYTRERPSWLVMLTLARFLSLRRLERLVYRAGFKPISFSGQSRLGAPSLDTVMPRLIEDGVAEGFTLSAEDVRAIVAFAATTPCFARGNGNDEFYPGDIDRINAKNGRDILAAYYFDRIERCPEIVAVQRDPLIRSIANAYVGQDSRHIRTRLWWSFPGQRIRDADLHAVAQEKFHFDMNDWRTLKFFFYLTDADAESGAHVYIAGSHRRRKLSHQATLMVGHEEEELVRYYGANRVRTVSGSAGSGFAEDPFVFHTGKRCRKAPRLLLEIEYGSRAHSPSYRYGMLG